MTDFHDKFKTEEDCLGFLRKLRWSEGKFKCPACGHRQGRCLRNRQLIECRSCGRQTSLTAGTIFHGHRVPLLKLFRIFWDFSCGASKSASQTASELNLPYSTVWTWMHKLRNLLSEKFHWEAPGEVHWSSFQKILFKRSAESAQTLSETETTGSLRSGSKPARAISSTLKKLSLTFHGISRKYLQPYLFQCAFTTKTQAKQMKTLLKAGLDCRPITRKAILEISSDEWILLPSFILP